MSNLHLTLWPDVKGRAKVEIESSWREFVESLETIEVVPKSRAPLIKLGLFGDDALPSGALRHDANMLCISGVEGDYDSGEMTPEQAIRKLEAENIRAVVVTTHNHKPESPRWRVFAPLSETKDPKERDLLVAALNGVLGGVLAVESYRLSQSFFIGREAGRVYQVLCTFDDPEEGVCIDRVDWARLCEIAVWPPSIEHHRAFEMGQAKPTAGTGLPDHVSNMLAYVPSHEYDTWIRVGAALHFCDSEAGLDVWDEWSKSSDKYPGREMIEQKWSSFDATKANGASAATLAYLARSFGYDGPVMSRREMWIANGYDKVNLTGFSIFKKPNRNGDLPIFASLEELMQHPELLEPPRPIVPRLAWKGRTTGLVGPDKSGKSTLMGHAIASLTRGVVFLGQELSQGTVLVVAPDEAVGDTIRRLKECEADPKKVRILTLHPERILDLLRDEMDRHPPDLLVVDSLAEWARLVAGRAPDDGDSAGWGSVIRPLVQLSRDYDCAIVLLHHPRRSDGQYRGSGEIAAALDCLLEIRLPNSGEDPTLRRFSGRARWPVEEFEIALRDGEYSMASEIDLPLSTRIFLDLQVAGPSSRQSQAERIKVRKSTYLAEVRRMVDDGVLIESENGLLSVAKKD